MYLQVCFISRGRRGGQPDSLGNSYGIIDVDDDRKKYRIESQDDGSTTMTGGADVPECYLDAINRFERDRHNAMDWSEQLLGARPEFTPRFDVPEYPTKVTAVSPYGTFI